jgi:hypothetical protein
MNPQRLLLAILAAFLTLFATDFVIHGIWLAPVYKATASLWRPEGEMNSHMGWLSAGQLLAAITFTMIWARGFAATARYQCAVIYGLCMALFSQANTLISYAVQPLTAEIVWKWIVAGVVQGVILGLVIHSVYKPLAVEAEK